MIAFRVSLSVNDSQPGVLQLFTDLSNLNATQFCHCPLILASTAYCVQRNNQVKTAAFFQ
jgi:hypothetical protein